MGSWNIHRRKTSKGSNFAQSYISSVDHATYLECKNKFNPRKHKRIIKTILADYERIKNIRDMKAHNSQLTQFFNPHAGHPILDMNGKIFKDLISWMIASTDTWKDRSSQERYQTHKKWCRLCQNINSIESRGASTDRGPSSDDFRISDAIRDSSRKRKSRDT